MNEDLSAVENPPECQIYSQSSTNPRNRISPIGSFEKTQLNKDAIKEPVRLSYFDFYPFLFVEQAVAGRPHFYWLLKLNVSILAISDRSFCRLFLQSMTIFM